MQAITTLHAQLCLATEKLETAQNLLIAQKSEISNIEEEGRIKQTEIKELSELLISSKEDERLELEKLGELKSQALPLEIEFERVSGAMEVLPFAFRKLSEDFSLHSRQMMDRTNSLLSLAIKENFWKNKIMMNLHHLNASRLRLKQLTTTLKQALIDEENSLNQQLAEEESSLAMVQACIETMEMKNGQAFFEKEARDKPQSFTSSYLLNSSELPHNHAPRVINDDYNKKHETPADMYREEGPRRGEYFGSDGTNDANETTCHGCHKTGHYISKCTECYKCQYCHKHHVKGKSCPSNHLSGAAASIGTRSAPISASASTATQIPDTLNENLTSREIHFSYDAPPDRLGIKHDSTSRGKQGSSSLQIERHPYSNFSSPYQSNAFNRSLASQYQQSRPLLPEQQKQRQQLQQHTYQAEGVVTHTLTHTVIEEVLESHHDSDSNGDRFRDSRDVDDRPWFQLMKRKRSVTETVKRDRDIDNSSYYGYEDADRRGDIDLHEGQQDVTQRHHSSHSATMHFLQGPSLSKTNETSSSPKPYSGFRSGLAILLDAEK